MMKRFSLVAMIFFLADCGLAQQLHWQHLNGPFGGIVGDLGINSKGHVYAGVYTFGITYTGLYKSFDNGDTWQKIQTPFAEFEVYALHLTRNDEVFVGTDHQGRIYRSLDDGQTWENKREGYTTGECWAFGEDARGNLFAGDGEFGGVFKSTDRGDNWRWVADLFPFVFVTASDGIVYCGSFLGLFASRDYGETWAQNNFLTNVPVSTLLLDDKNGLYAGTGYYNNGNGVYLSRDGGANWTHLGLEGKVVLSLAFDSHKKLYAGTLRDGLFMTPDTGKTWQQYTEGLYRKQVFRLKLNARDHIFIGSESEGVFRSLDGGQNFKQIGLPVSKVSNIVFSGDSLIFAATPSGVQSYDRVRGAWRNLGLQEVEAIDLGPSAELYAATFREGLYRSMDLGETWTQTRLTENELFSVYNVKVLHDGIVLAATENQLQRSSDGGETWSVLPPRTGYFYRGLALDSDHDVWVGAFGAKNPVLYKSSNNGVTFDSVFSGLHFIHTNNISTSRGRNIFVAGALGDSGGLFRSLNDGATWKPIILNTPVGSVYADDQGRVYGGSRSAVLFSGDGGDTWSEIPYQYQLKPDDYVREIEADTRGTLFFGTLSEGLFQVTLGTGVEEASPAPEGSYMLHQNYPNPFNPVTTIRYFIPKREHVQLRIYEVTGKVVVTLVDGYQIAGTHRVEFDGSLLPSGVYFYRLRAGEFLITRKMTLVR